MKLTSEKSKQLKKRLPHGCQRKIAKKLKISEDLISKVINGKRNDHQGIIEIAISIAENEEKRRKRLIDKI